MCCDGALRNERHLVFEYAALAPLRQTYAELATNVVDSMRGFFHQQEHVPVFHLIVDCLDFMGKQMHLLFLPFFGTSFQFER